MNFIKKALPLIISTLITTPAFVAGITNGTNAITSDTGIAIGNESQAKGEYSTATGQYAHANKNYSTAIGAFSDADGERSTAIGTMATAYSDNATAIGGNSSAQGERSIAIGSNAIAEMNTTNAMTVGANSYAGKDNAVALGAGALGYAENSVALGANSVADRENTVSVGAAGNERQIANVVAGTEDTDAVNVAQLNRSSTNTLHSAKVYTDSTVSTTLATAANYTDSKVSELRDSTNSRFSQIDKRIGRVERKLNAAVAGVIAIASIPYVTEKTFSWGIGAGNYQNGNAMAAGISYKMSPGTNIRMNMSWDSSSNSAVGLGMAGGW